MEKEMFTHPLVWWRDVPIDVEDGLLSYLSDVWKNKIYIVSINGYEEARKKCGWSIKNFSNIHFITGKEEIKISDQIIQYLLCTSECLHIFSGIKGGHRVFLNKLRRKNTAKCVFIMEAPSLYGSNAKKYLKNLAYPILYYSYYREYNNQINGLFAMGNGATILYKNYGWKNTLPFMYLPNLSKFDNEIKTTTEIKFLYIGRFEFETKGLDVLMKAIDFFDETSNWKLDLIGGYGKNRNEVINWSTQKQNVNFLGKWDSDTVVANMSQYDCCIVPSKYDGWNLTPQQAIHAGIPCIVTNGAGSQEIIEDSKAGMVIEKDDVNALVVSIKKVIDSPNLLKEWKVNAQKYVEKISVNNVGKYFIDGLAYFYGFSNIKPQKTW